MIGVADTGPEMFRHYTRRRRVTKAVTVVKEDALR
jgi:hypothetical protein